MNKRSVGTDYEALAARYLEQRGMQILCRNFRTRSGEIDLIARDGRYLVFVEVKYRANSCKGTALEAVDRKKQRIIVQTARFYLRKYRYSEQTPCRFDVVGITGDEITYLANAFWAEE